MKTSKRILGVALVLIMIFNVFAVGTFAAGTESAVDLYLSTDKEVYAPGEDITITVSASAISAVGALRIGGNYAIGYNSAAIKPYSDAIDNLDAHAVTALQAGYDSTIAGIAAPVMSSLDAEGAATYGWDSFIIYGLTDDLATSFDASAKTDLFTFKMKVADDAANGTYTIGFNKDSYVNYEGYINDAAMGGIYGYNDDYGYGTAANYGFNNVTITVGAAAEEYDLKWVENQWRNSVNVEGAYDVGVKFGFDVSDIDIQFEGTRSTNVARVGAEIYDANGDRVQGTFESEFVYEVGSEYHYRVIIEGLAKADTTKYTVKPYLVYVDESLDVVYGETVTVCAADVIPQ